MRWCLLLVASLASVASAEDDFDDDELQSEFILPYSETEDVDFRYVQKKEIKNERTANSQET